VRAWLIDVRSWTATLRPPRLSHLAKEFDGERLRIDPSLTDMNRELRHYRYLLLFLALVPFGAWVLSGQASQQWEAAMVGVPTAESPFLAADSQLPWLFAVISAALFAAAAIFLLDGKRVGLLVLVATTAFTATIGIVLLLAVQRIANQSSHEDWSGSASWMLLHFLLNGIAYSYRASGQSDGNFWVQLIGYIFGVGFCEETTKLLPVLYRMWKRVSVSAVEVRVIGFMSGVGFGVAEGVLYSQRQYNGVSTSTVYIIRFVSVVAMHGFSTAVAAGLLFRRRFQDELDVGESGWKLLAKFTWIIFPAMLLHALYDIYCDRGMFDAALCCELILLAILAFQIDRGRSLALAAVARR
jgi:RsiW-degrading membrane proteinase PrsW (M82 family)